MMCLEETLEKLGAYICDELCYHRDVGADKGDYEIQEICEKCELGGYLDEIRKCLSCENSSEITRSSRGNGGWIPVNKRLHRNGQTERVIIHHLVCEGTRDEDVMAALDKKENVQNFVMDSLKARIRKVKERKKA